MRTTDKAIVVLVLLSCTACMSSAQKAQIDRLEGQAAHLGHPEVKYRNTLDPDTALGLGFAPFGLGGFYVDRPGLGVSGLLWPLSITWLPFQAYNTALESNVGALETQVAGIKDAQLGLAPGTDAAQRSTP